MTETRNLADFVFPNDVMEIKDIEAKYQPRQLKEGQMVTRFAPSPTGFLHIGAIYTSMIDLFAAKQSGGICYLRIEDTDQKRQVENSVQFMVNGLKNFGITFDEGVDENLNDYGAYAPYTQSQRKTIYRSYAKELLKQGKAYLCFCAEDDLEKMRHTQEIQKQRPGYYGRFATCRSLSEEQVWAKIDQGLPFVLRLKSQGNYNKRVKFVDVIRGERYLPENDIDPIILKSDGLPTYHFAHIVDDYLMGTTHVIRGDEWLSSVPLHLEMFQLMGWKAPRYAHVAPMQKMDGEARRKLSKRKDPEADVAHFFEQGYPIEAIKDYLMNIINSNFEDWRKKNQKAEILDFKMDLGKASVSGALFDQVKLDNISKNIISEFTKEEVYQKALSWAKTYDADFEKLLLEHADFMRAVFNIERESKRKRKDFVKWSTLKEEVSYFFDERFTRGDMSLSGHDKDVISKCLGDYISILNNTDTHEEWWNKVKQLAEANQFASDMEAFKAEPTKYRGNVADFMKMIRLAVRGRVDSPDLYEVMHVMGLEKTKQRLQSYL